MIMIYFLCRIDCYPETVPQVQEHCEARGCCYDPHVHLNDDVPWCFYPSDYPTYKVSSLMVIFLICQLYITQIFLSINFEFE